MNLDSDRESGAGDLTLTAKSSNTTLVQNANITLVSLIRTNRTLMIIRWRGAVGADARADPGRISRCR
jgi:hypothetical protein